MESRKIEKITTLLLAVATVPLSLIHPGYEAVGIYRGGPLTGRLLYPFFHAGPLHAVLNAWCLVGIVFIYPITAWRMLLSYAVAVSVPSVLLQTTPTVGLSGMVFFLFGTLSFLVARRLYYQGWMLFYLTMGFLLPGTSGRLHLYCYLLGLAWAILNKPYTKK